MRKVFADFGIDINEENGRYYLTYDKGEIVVEMTTIEISKADAEKAQSSANEAYEVILKYQNAERSAKR